MTNATAALLPLLLAAASVCVVLADDDNNSTVALEAVELAANSNGNIKSYLKKSYSDSWWKNSAKSIADNILKHQCSDGGGWPTDKDTTKSSGAKSSCKSTYDDFATVSEVMFLSRTYAKTKTSKYKDAARKGLKYVINGQYGNGGWPQSVKGKGYHAQITFNDNVVVNNMKLMREVYENDPPVYDYAKDLRSQCRKAFDNGINVIVKTQVKKGSKKLGWGAQHDKSSLEPTCARAYEPTTMATKESTTILRLLMSISNPSSSVKNAIRGGIAWLESISSSKWPRFIDLKSEKGVYCKRTSGWTQYNCESLKYDCTNNSSYGRSGYSWTGTWPKKAITEYAKWEKKN